MITAHGPKVLEFNVRFGDPETQVLMPVLDIDFGRLVASLAEGSLARNTSAAARAAPQRAALGVVIASRGYPQHAEKGALVEPLAATGGGESLVFHAATRRGADGKVRTEGGRCFTAVGMGVDLAAASARAYEAAARCASTAGGIGAISGESSSRQENEGCSLSHRL